MATKTTETATDSVVADASDKVIETFVYENADQNSNTVWNFDTLSGSDFIQDTVDLSAIFEQIGGIYTDGIADLSDRIAAIEMSYGDFDGDGETDDAKLTIADADDFTITFIDPSSNAKGAFDIGDGTGLYDNVVVEGDLEEDDTTNATAVLYADAERLISETYGSDTFSASSQNTIHDFDNISYDGSSSDTIDLSAVFDELGGVFSDGLDDVQDRVEAVHVERADLDGDGTADDIQITIDGAGDFILDLIDPESYWTTAFEIGADASSDIMVGETAGTSSVAGSEADAVDTTDTAQSDTETTDTATTDTAATDTTDTSSTQSDTTATTDDTVTADGSGYLNEYPASWARLDNGVNIERSEYSSVTQAELDALAESGVEHIRLSLNSELTYTAGEDFDLENNSHFQTVMEMVDKVIDAGMAVVITPAFNANADFLDGGTNSWSVEDYARYYAEFATYINDHYSPEDVFIESVNEPFMVDNEAWWEAQAVILEAVREAAPDFTFIASANGRIGESGWSFINSLTAVEAYDDDNVVYNIHYYTPQSFTAQGATWNDYFSQFSDVHYPGAEGYDAEAIQEDMATLAAWAEENNAFITVNEFGAIKNAEQDERVLWLNDVREAIEEYGWGWTVWEYNKIFGIAEENADGTYTVTDDFLEALTWGDWQDDLTTWLDWAQGTVDEAVLDALSGVLDTTVDIVDTTDGSSGGSSGTSSESTILTADDIGQTTTIESFDNIWSDDGSNDQIDFTAIFEALGGVYTDGSNDSSDREAALEFTLADLDGDGSVDDIQVTIDGVDDFAVDLLDVTSTWLTAFDIGASETDDILI